MRTRILQVKTLIGEGHDTVDKTITFDFTRTGLNGIFMVENINEWFELDNACVGCNDTVTVKGWIYKNVAYKEVTDENYDTDENGNPVVWGPINHMTTRIAVQACIAIEQEDGCRGHKHLHLCPEDNVEVKAEVSSCSDQLIGTDTIDIPDVYPPFRNYDKLEEVVCVNIKVRVYRYEEVEVPFEHEC
ncbi:hypothetical protein ABFP60_10830 [Clostridioides difficile]